MDKGTGAEGRPLDAVKWIAEYQPREIDRTVWQAVRPFVLVCIDSFALGRGPGAQRVVRVLTKLAGWAVGEGLPLDVEVVLDPDTVERFVAVGLPDDRSRATYRAVLRRIGPKLTKTAPWEARPASVARRQVAVPYTAQELVGLTADALAQPTAGRIRAARALLALGAGAGLDGRWVARVTASDVTSVGRIVVVSVAEPSARVVPVLARWENEVLDLAASAGADFVVGGGSRSRNRAGALAASLVVGNGHPRFSASRLRSTWLATHLAMGTRLPELVRAAGLQGVTVLSDLLAFVPAVETDDALGMLRGVR